MAALNTHALAERIADKFFGEELDRFVIMRNLNQPVIEGNRPTFIDIVQRALDEAVAAHQVGDAEIAGESDA